MEGFVLGEGLEDRLVGGREVRLVARQDRPAKRPLALAEERPHEERHEAAEVEGVPDPRLQGLAPFDRLQGALKDDAHLSITVLPIHAPSFL